MGFSDALAFAVVMTLRDMNKEKEKRLIKTQKFYQECYERITEDSKQVFDIVSNVVQKAAGRYIPVEIGTGSTYLALYAFAQVIEKQGQVTKEQSKLIKIYFDNFDYPFSESAYLYAAKTGTEIADFRKIIAITKSQVGGFWINFFRALYKAGTQKDLQDVTDLITSMMMRFSVLGKFDNGIVRAVCQEFVDSVNYQMSHIQMISNKEVDWFGMIPVSERLAEIRELYEGLVDDSNITDEISKSELLSMLELLLLNCICDIAMMTNQPKTIKMQMMNEGAAFVGIHSDVTPEQYVREIANNTDTGQAYRTMFSARDPLGSMWLVILTMGGQINRRDDAMTVINDIFSILLQVENYLDEKYRFLGKENIARDYTLHIIEQLAEVCD